MLSTMGYSKVQGFSIDNSFAYLLEISPKQRFF